MSQLVSILIPIYNAELWIAETLESVLNQTWKNREIILVDDGSTDKSLIVAKSFESPVVKVIAQENQGASAARNRALREAQGDFIQYLDADDLLAPDKIERQMQLLSAGNANCIAAGEWARFYNSPTEAYFIPESVWNDMSPIDWLICSWEGGGMMPLHAWLVPRPIAEAAGSWNEGLSLNDDGEYFCRVLLASRGVTFCRGAKALYRSGIPGSLSGSKSRVAWESYFHSLELCMNHLLAREDSSRTRHACATFFQRFIYEVYPDVPELWKKAEARVQQLGGSELKPHAGPMFKLLSHIVGWQQAKRIQKFVYRYGYRKAAVGWKLAQLIKRLVYRLNTTA